MLTRLGESYEKAFDAAPSRPLTDALTSLAGPPPAGTVHWIDVLEMYVPAEHAMLPTDTVRVRSL